jgi:flagellar motor switch/type III secretory pathway protein FliN
MPGAELAQYGLATFAVAGLLYIVNLFLTKRKDNDELMAVIENNTKAIDNLSNVMQTLQMSLVRQEAKIDELLERARR